MQLPTGIWKLHRGKLPIKDEIREFRQKSDFAQNLVQMISFLLCFIFQKRLKILNTIIITLNTYSSADFFVHRGKFFIFNTKHTQ